MVEDMDKLNVSVEIEPTRESQIQSPDPSGALYVLSLLDKLDDQEQFDKLEMERIVSQDPDALAFFQAQKTRRANLTQNRTQLRQMHRNKRN